ncbi:MAG: hypothetical protein HYT62_05065 [Candidatus Yanofskybacteria bacterium]|nr:hypothetical protein [Candidatus Yanofskybacteria bacterium]
MTTRVLKYLILLACALLVVAVSSFWFGSSSFRDKDVVLELEGPTQASSGDEVVYKLKYSNTTRSNLSNLNFVFFYPEGSTVITDTGTSDDSSEEFNIESLAPGEKGEKELRAFLLGERGNIKVAKATLSFRAGNLRSTFEKTATLSTTIVNTPISLTLVAPPSAVSGQSVTYILDYRNESDEDATDLILTVDYPDGFTPKEYNPKPKSSNNSWEVKLLKKGSGERISITGSLNGQEGENKVVSATLKRKVGDRYVDYQKASAATVISNPVLGVEVFVNGVSDYSSSPGDRLSYTVKYGNNSNMNLFGMNLVVKLEGDMFDLSALDTRGGFFDEANKTITWNSTTVPDFSNFEPNKRGQVGFNITLKSFFPSLVTGAPSDRFVKVSVKFGTPNIPTGFSGDDIAVSASLVTKIGTQPGLNQSAYYNDPNFGSSGPLPPKVGEDTFYTIHWQLTNPGNAVDSAKVVGKLPQGVEWVDTTKSSSGPAPVFNANSSEVIWNLGALPYGTGIFNPKYEASFKIKIRPTNSQKGNTLQLIDNVQLTGTDSFTKQPVIVNGGSLSSNNLVDRPKEGTVQ